MASHLPTVLCLFGLLLTPRAEAAAPDTTVAGRTYALLDAEELLARLQKTAPIHLRATAVTGRLYAPTAGLDTVRAALICEDVLFFDEITLNNVVFLGPVHCDRTVFAGGLSLLGARFQDTFSLRETRFSRHLNLKQAEFASDVDFSGSEFAEPSSLIGARFNRNARFTRARFAAATYFEGAHFAGQTDFSEVHFAGVASFKDAVWDQATIFAGARFDERALFWRNLFLAEADFTAARADGEIAFTGTAFAATADFTDFTFAQAVHFADVTFERATFRGSFFRKEADFSGAEARTLQLGAFFNQTLDLRYALIGTLDLRPSAGADSTFSRSATIYLQQAYLDRVLVRWSQLRGHLAVPDSAASNALEPIYASLRHHFLLQGLQRDAEDCQIELLEHQRHSLKPGKLKRWALELWNLSSRYGTDPQQLVLFILSVILLFGLSYRLAPSSMQPVYGEGAPTLADCIGFSIDTFTHAGYHAWYATGKLKLLASVEALMGWISLGLLIAVALAHLL